jgi:alpha-beta hydrolase superfamily lysophospholipase
MAVFFPSQLLGNLVMKHYAETVDGSGHCSLYYQCWYPEESSQAVVVLVHGLGGHSGLFQTVVDYLVPQGYAVYALDLRGHGRSMGQRGHINSWQEFRADLQRFLQQIQAQHRCCPYILWGHSLGGTIALDYALHFPDDIQGLILTAPALGKVRIAPLKLAVGCLLSKIAPRFSLKVGIRTDAGSRDPAVVAAIAADPLRHTYGSARLATEFLATVNWIYAHANELTIPLLIMHGSGDRVTLPEGSRAFFQRVIFPDKQHHEYPGSYHDVFMDLDYHTMFRDLDVWLDAHLVGAEKCQAMIDQAV